MTGSATGTSNIRSLKHASFYGRLMAILLIALVGLFAFRGLVPAWRTLNTDFPNYFVAASLHARGIPLDRAYEWTWFERQKDHLGINQPLVGFAPHPPLCALPFLPLTRLSALSAKRVWLVANLLFLVGVFWILQRETKLSWISILTLGFSCIVPLRSNMLDGQYYVLILLLIGFSYVAWRHNWHVVSGLLLAVAAALKLFPGAFVLLFLWKRQWRAVAGLVIGFTALSALSILFFGWNVHRAYVVEVLPRALRGDLLAPYSLAWSSLNAYWHHAFLYEPELNPNPLLNSVSLFAGMQALTTVVLWFSYLFRVPSRLEPKDGLEWSAFVLLLLLLNPMPSSYQYCVLIFSAIVGWKALAERGRTVESGAFILLYAVACLPWRGSFAISGPPLRLVATVLMYILYLTALPHERRLRLRNTSIAAVACLVLFVANLRGQAGRDQDFGARLQPQSNGYRYANPVALGNDTYLFTEMTLNGYVASSFASDSSRVSRLPLSPDVLSLAASRVSSFAILENTRDTSSLLRADIRSREITDMKLQGQEPALSQNGQWLAYLQQDGLTSSVWRLHLSANSVPERVYSTQRCLFELTVGEDGTVIASEGDVVHSEFVRIKADGSVVERSTDIAGPVRFPAFSADGSRLAFSRRAGGSWHLFVRDMNSGQEEQLTRGSCNATEASWENAQSLLYATDCARGLGLTAIARTTIK